MEDVDANKELRVKLEEVKSQLKDARKHIREVENRERERMWAADEGAARRAREVEKLRKEKNDLERKLADARIALRDIDPSDTYSARSRLQALLDGLGIDYHVQRRDSQDPDALLLKLAAVNYNAKRANRNVDSNGWDIVKPIEYK